MAGSDTNDEKDRVEDAREAFKRAEEHESENRTQARDDILFARLGEQWPEQIRKDRELECRPCLTINRLPTFIRQVVNDARQNKPGINVHPADSKADSETADIINGLIRQIERTSDAEVAYDTALDSAVTGGWGYFKVNTRYACDDSFDQDIVIERVANPFSIYGDPNSTAADSSDWMTAFEIDTLSRKAFKARWKDADPVSFDATAPDANRDEKAERITIAAFWEREEVRRRIVAVSMPAPDADPQQVAMALALGVSDQLILDLSTYEANAALFQALGMTVTGQPRDVPSYAVTQSILSGADELETVKWAGKYIPIIPVYGEEVNLDGIRHWRGLVRDAKDPQRNFNYWRTQATELVALAPKAPFVGRKGAFETDMDKWATMNTQAHAFVQYDGGEAPQRQPFAGVPAGAVQEAANAADDIKSILGMFNASLGAEGNETSGRAILARQRQSDTGSFHFIDNLSRAIRHGGRVVLDLIPTVYSTSRVLRILGKDGKQMAVKIAGRQPQDDAQEDGQQPAAAPGSGPTQQGPGAMPAAMPGQMPGQGPMQQPGPAMDPALADRIEDIERIYDLGLGKYDLTVQAGPAYSTLREELNTVLMELVRAAPEAAPAVMDIIVKTLDIPDAEEVAERFQAMAEQRQGQQTNPAMEQLKQQASAALNQAHQEIDQLTQKLQDATSQQAAQDARKADIDAALKERELGIRETEAQAKLITAQAASTQAAHEAQMSAFAPLDVVGA